ncbi:hypothetical protein N0V93_006272 [Gnomoniopsis smithogilvyi]|uniref:Uncharacterized protein n=1 Tax=Gnomoniopsis smithogilvyi TaxID=1191159 RepID=A0A9W8YMX7_9PEZI|nr:hypothetical protein N0V93_006272 [Gnomoniopsis smithogilvyi]
MPPISTALSTKPMMVLAAESQNIIEPLSPSELPREVPPSPQAGIYHCRHPSQQASAYFANKGSVIEQRDHDPSNEDDQELRDLEREGYAPGGRVELCTAQAGRICPPGSASMVHVHGRGGWRQQHGLSSSSSVRGVRSLPDLSSAQAALTTRGGKGRRERVGTKKVEIVGGRGIERACALPWILKRRVLQRGPLILKISNIHEVTFAGLIILWHKRFKVQIAGLTAD